MMRYHTVTSILIGSSLLLLFSLLLQMPTATVVQATAISIKAELNSTKFSLDQAVLLTITLSGTRSAEPSMPKADGLQFAYRGQNSQTQWINGEISSSRSFVFVVQAEKTGTHTIEPIKVTVDGKVYMTEPITCTVLQASPSNTPPATGRGVQSGQGGAPSARLRSGEAEKIGFMRITPEKNRVYSGQLIPFTIKAFFRQGMRVTLKSNPRFVGENFILQSIDEKPRQREELINGESYISLSWTGSFSAVKEGSFPLEVEMNADLLIRTQQQNTPRGSRFLTDQFFDDFFAHYSHREVKVASPEKSITIMDLPTEGRPDDFQGAIGTFSLAVAASPVKGNVGDPITLKMVITGTGNFDMVHSPDITDKNGWKTYPATDTFEERSPDSGKKIFEQALVPTLPSLTAIPPIQFSYFDPDADEYISLVSDPINIQLENNSVASTASNRPENVNSSPTRPDSQAPSQGQNNFAPLHTETGKLVHAIQPLYRRSWFLLLLITGIVCLAVSLPLYLRRKKLEGDPTILLHKQVNKQLRHHFQEMENAIGRQDQGSFCTHCRAAIQKRLGEIWRMEARAITLADLQQRLPADSPVLDILTRLEHTGYSGNRFDQDTLKAMLNTTHTELDKLS